MVPGMPLQASSPAELAESLTRFLKLPPGHARATRLLAVVGDAAQVVALLEHPDPQVRRCRCGPVSELDAIVPSDVLARQLAAAEPVRPRAAGHPGPDRARTPRPRSRRSDASTTRGEPG